MDLLIRILFYFLFSIKYALPSTVSRFDSEIKLFQSSDTYAVESTALLSDLDKEIGFKVKATLKVQPVWKNTENDYLLKFNLQSPQLLSKSKNDYLPQTSMWDSFPKTEFYAHWQNGIILGAYLDSSEPVDVLNLKKSLVSLFQFNVFEIEGNETDVSGLCDIQYETVSICDIRKIKRQCTWGVSEINNDVMSRRITLYKLGEALNTINEIHAEEIHGLKDESLQAHAWLRLQREPTHSEEPLNFASGPMADQLPSTLQSLPLTMASTPEDLIKKMGTEELATLLDSEAEALDGSKPGEGGTVRAAAAVLRVLPALASAQRATLAALLHKNNDPDRLSSLCRLLGLAGTRAAHRAADHVLQLRTGDASLQLAHQYFEGLALAPEPEESVVTEVLQLGEEISHKDVSESALLAAAAAASRLPAAANAPRAARDALARSLARCKDDECRAVRLLALGNLRRADAAELLLEHAERGPAAVSVAALDALSRVPNAAFTRQRLARLEQLALTPSSLELRAAALDLFLCRMEPRPPLALLDALTGAPAELRRLMWQRLSVLADEDPRWRSALNDLPLVMRGWSTRAITGTSALLMREAGSSGGWRTQLQSVQLTRAGLLRRARVTLNTLTPSGAADDTLAVELWSRGLQSLAGGEAEADGSEPEDEAVAGGLAFVVGGARTRSLTLFESQGELLGHVWAGTGSEPTSVLRALRPLSTATATLPLLGTGPLTLTRHAAVAMAMDAQAQVSLWSRNARTALTLRGAAVSESHARVSAAGRTLTADTHHAVEPRLHIAADVDFYGDTAMCVRVSTDGYERTHNATLRTSVGGAGRSERRTARRLGAGRTLALGALNDATCNTLGAL